MSKVSNNDFGNLEKIEEKLLSITPSFSLHNVVTLGKRDKLGCKKNFIQERNYNSNKYTDFSFLSSLTIDRNDFIVFRYNSYDKDSGSKKEDIFMSYFHLKKIREILETLLEKFDDAFIDKTFSINPEYEDFSIDIECINGKHILFFYEWLEIVEENVDYPVMQKSVGILFNNEEYQEYITEENLEELLYFIENFNLLNSSQNLMITSYLSRIYKKLNNESINEGAKREQQKIVIKRKSENKKE